MQRDIFLCGVLREVVPYPYHVGTTGVVSGSKVFERERWYIALVAVLRAGGAIIPTKRPHWCAWC